MMPSVSPGVESSIYFNRGLGRLHKNINARYYHQCSLEHSSHHHRKPSPETITTATIQIKGIKRFSGCGKSRKKFLTDKEVTLIHLRATGVVVEAGVVQVQDAMVAWNADPCCLRFYMRNDSLYMVAVALSTDGGHTFGQTFELLDPLHYRLRVIRGSEAMGDNFTPSYQDLKRLKIVSRVRVLQAFVNVTAFLAGPHPSNATPDKAASFKADLDLLIMFMAESARNLWVAEAFQDVINGLGQITNMRNHYAQYYFWKWKEYTEQDVQWQH